MDNIMENSKEIYLHHTNSVEHKCLYVLVPSSKGTNKLLLNTCDIIRKMLV